MNVIQVTITHPDVPVIGGCFQCGKSMRSEWYDRDDVISDPMCEACDNASFLSYLDEMTQLAKKGDKVAIEALEGLDVMLPEPI